MLEGVVVDFPVERSKIAPITAVVTGQQIGWINVQV